MSWSRALVKRIPNGLLIHSERPWAQSLQLKTQDPLHIYFQSIKPLIIQNTSYNSGAHEIIPTSLQLNIQGETITRIYQLQSDRSYLNIESVEIPKMLTVKSNKPTVLMVADTHEWCFDRIAQQIKRWHSHQYDFTIDYISDKPNYRQKYGSHEFDVVLKIWYGAHHIDPFKIYSKAHKIVCVRDYDRWINPGRHQDLLRYNLSVANVVLPGCTETRLQLRKVFPDLIPRIIMAEAHGGVDHNKFEVTPYIPHDKLRVGWVGNANVKCKRVPELKAILKSCDFVELVLQTTDNRCSFDQMKQFYENIDLIACYSETEGTPNPILEASCCGRAWISTSVGIVPHMYHELGAEHRRPGWIANTPEEWIDTLKYIHTHRHEMAERGKYGRQYVEQYYTWQAQSGLFAKHLKAPIPILCASTQYAGYGGAATNTYGLIKMLRSVGHPVVGVFFHETIHVNYDPENLGGIFIHTKNHDRNVIRQQVLSYLGCTPALSFAKNYLAPVYCKKIFDIPTIYSITGINHMSMRYKSLSAQQVLDPSFVIREKIDEEIECVNISDLMIANSFLSLQLFRKIYAQHPNLKKVYEKAVDLSTAVVDIQYDAQTPKKYDIVICCSRLDRTVKNSAFMIELAKHASLSHLKWCVIGAAAEALQSLSHVDCVGLITPEQCIDYMKQSKILIIPSRFDANPNAAHEALHVKCLPIISNNVGWYELYPTDLVCANLEQQEWINKILHVHANYEQLKHVQIPFQPNFMEEWTNIRDRLNV